MPVSFHGGNTGSNPVGDANKIKALARTTVSTQVAANDKVMRFLGLAHQGYNARLVCAGFRIGRSARPKGPLPYRRVTQCRSPGAKSANSARYPHARRSPPKAHRIWGRAV